MNALKRQQEIWARELIKWISSLGITHCEWPGCTSTFGVAPAHSLKRRFIGWSKSLYFEAVYLCGQHHHYIEYGDSKHRGTHRRMRRLILVLLRRRKIQWVDDQTIGEQVTKFSKTANLDKECGVMQEEINGFRRTSVKTKDKNKIKQKKEEFEERGEEVIVKESAGYYYLYVKKEKEFGR